MKDEGRAEERLAIGPQPGHRFGQPRTPRGFSILASVRDVRTLPSVDGGRVRQLPGGTELPMNGRGIRGAEVQDRPCGGGQAEESQGCRQAAGTLRPCAGQGRALS